MSDRERSEIRRQMERFEGRLRRQGMSPDKAREQARETALYVDRRKSAKEKQNG
jgi:hypothetical protein